MAIMDDEEPKRKKAVPRSIAEVEQVAEKLRQQIETLGEALDPVLRRPKVQDTEENTGTNSRDAQDLACDYERQLRDIRDVLRNSNRQLAEILERLEA